MVYRIHNETQTQKHIVIDWLLTVCRTRTRTHLWCGWEPTIERPDRMETMCKILMKRKKCILEIAETRDAHANRTQWYFDSAVWYRESVSHSLCAVAWHSLCPFIRFAHTPSIRSHQNGTRRKKYCLAWHGVPCRWFCAPSFTHTHRWRRLAPIAHCTIVMSEPIWPIAKEVWTHYISRRFRERDFHSTRGLRYTIARSFYDSFWCCCGCGCCCQTLLFGVWPFSVERIFFHCFKCEREC